MYKHPKECKISMSVKNAVKPTRRPADNNLTQQRLLTRPANFKPIHLAIMIVLIGIIFLPIGSTILTISNKVYEDKFTYDDGSSTSFCAINATNEGRSCQIIFNITDDITGPIYVYYQLSNFYQNHRRYYQSRSISQLQGQLLTEDDVKLDCAPLYLNGSLLLNPCGLTAMSFFNDVFVLDNITSSPQGLILDETGIAVQSDSNALFKQVSGFKSKAVSSGDTNCTKYDLPESCKSYYDSNEQQYYLFYYPDDDTTQYLYETYPNQISPLDGVTDEHFIVWMRTSSMPTFRKLYGTIGNNLKKGDVLVFNIQANYYVSSFDATKSLIVSSIGPYGGQNAFPGQVFITVGAFSLFFGLLLIFKEYYLLKHKWQ